MYVCMYVWVCIYIIYIYTCVCVCVCVCVCLSVWARVFSLSAFFSLYMYVYIYTLWHTHTLTLSFSLSLSLSGTQSWPNNGQDFTAGSEVYGVFAGAVKTNLAQVLRAASHRIEIEKIASVARRAGSSVTVTYLIHPDDTGKDLRTVGSLLEKAQSPAIKDAVVGNLAAFAATAQTTNPAAQGISKPRAWARGYR